MSVANTGNGTVTTVGYLPVLVANTTTTVPEDPSATTGKLYTFTDFDETHVYNITLNYDFEFPPQMSSVSIQVYTFDGAFTTLVILSTVPVINDGSATTGRYSTQVNLTPSTVTWAEDPPTYWFTVTQFNGLSASMVVNFEAIITDLGIFVAG
jgi:hypothetical protein